MGTITASQVYGNSQVSSLVDADPNPGASAAATVAGLPEGVGGAAAPGLVWAGMVGLLVALRLVWEFAGKGK